MSPKIAVKTAVKPVTALLAITAVVAISAVAIAVGLNLSGGLPATVTYSCIDPNETVNKDVPQALISKYLAFFNPDVKSKAQLKPYGSYYEDKCLIDMLSTTTRRLADGSTRVITVAKSTPVNECSAADENNVTARNCRLQEGFCTINNGRPAVSNYYHKCPDGCRNGACIVVADQRYGSVVRSASMPDELYYIGYDSRIAGYGKFAFPRALPYYPEYNTFDSWYYNQDDVLTISNTELMSYPIRGNVTYRPGTELLKISTDDRIWAVEPGGILRNMGNSSSTYLTALYGLEWYQRVMIVPDSFWTNYVPGPDWLYVNKHPEGTVIQYSGSSDKYLISNGQKRKFVGTGFTDNRYQEEYVVTGVATSTFVYDSGMDIVGPEKELLNVAGSLLP